MAVSKNFYLCVIFASATLTIIAHVLYPDNIVVGGDVIEEE